MNEDLSKTAFKCSAQGPLEVADFAPQKHRGLRGTQRKLAVQF